MSQHNSKDRYYADLPLVIIPVVSGRRSTARIIDNLSPLLANAWNVQFYFLLICMGVFVHADSQNLSKF